MKNKKLFFAIVIIVVVIALVIVIATRKQKPEIIYPDAPVAGEKVPERSIKELFGIDPVTGVFAVKMGAVNEETETFYAKQAFEQDFVGVNFTKVTNPDINYQDIPSDCDYYLTVLDLDKKPVLYILQLDVDKYFICREPLSESNFKDNIYEVK